MKLLICSLCKSPIEDEPKFYSELAFHSKHLEIYLKLVGAYGESRITDVGPSGVITGNFFFIDIVGLWIHLFLYEDKLKRLKFLITLFLHAIRSKKQWRRRYCQPVMVWP